MKQIEITVRLNEDVKVAMKKLEKLGYKKIRESNIEDIYLTSKLNELNKDNIQYILKKSVLLRKLKLADKEIKKITYKNKEYDEKGTVISESKINLDCSDLEKAEELFKNLDFERLVVVKYHVIVYSKGTLEYAFQIVENLGTLIEYENSDDFANKSISDVNIAKEEMYNQILETGINITKEKDVKKAYELIAKSLV